jgi:hypothetical protein
MVTINQLAGITAQHNEIVKRVSNGSLDPAPVKRALQEIIEGRFISSPPFWWRTPEQQLARARQLWPGTVLPDPPKEFTPRTPSEVLLLHVPDTFDGLWSFVSAPEGYTKYRHVAVKSDQENLRYAPGKAVFINPVWLAFDPEHGKGERPDSLWGQANCAASEVLSALIQFPEWPLTWFDDAPAPCLTGYQLKYDGNWSCVPCIYRWTPLSRQLKLGVFKESYGYKDWASPSVREC